MLIDGDWVDAPGRSEVINPANQELVATVARGQREHADRAVAAAKEAFAEGTWPSTPPSERAAVLTEAAGRLAGRLDELASMQSRENGTPVRLAGAFHVGLPIVHLQYLADLAHDYDWVKVGPEIGPVPAEGIVRRAPIGVWAAVLPWQAPLLVAVWQLAPALVAGNTVVVKPHECAPLLVLELAKELEASGLPPGVLNVVTGGEREIRTRLGQHPDVGGIAFTGSTEAGREVARAAADNVKRVTLALGGKCPMIVLDDADVETAIDGALFACLAYSGQVSEAGSRLLLPDALHDRFVDRMLERVATLRLSDPADPATDIGPLISREHQQRVLGYIESARQEGATVACGGVAPGGPLERGHWVEPTILTDVQNHMRVAREEIFGPVLCVLRYGTVEEAVAIANDSPYGLAAGVWGADESRALHVADQLRAGVVWINDWHVIACEYPFGGVKQSGLGRALGPNALDDYTASKFISIDRSGGLEGKPYGLLLSTPPS